MLITQTTHWYKTTDSNYIAHSNYTNNSSFVQVPGYPCLVFLIIID